MTQLFKGYKPGAGPVLKVLKYNGDDARTLPNDAFDRYLFNSENQNLSYGLTAEPFYFRAADLAAGVSGVLPSTRRSTNMTLGWSASAATTCCVDS